MKTCLFGIRIFCATAAVFCLGCSDSSDSAALNDLKKQLDGVVHDTSKALQDLRQRKSMTKSTEFLTNDAANEVENLFRFEYQVLELERSISAERLGEKVNSLGQKRWDCFHIEPVAVFDAVRQIMLNTSTQASKLSL